MVEKIDMVKVKEVKETMEEKQILEQVGAILKVLFAFGCSPFYPSTKTVSRRYLLCTAKRHKGGCG